MIKPLTAMIETMDNTTYKKDFDTMDEFRNWTIEHYGEYKGIILKNNNKEAKDDAL